MTYSEDWNRFKFEIEQDKKLLINCNHVFRTLSPRPTFWNQSQDGFANEADHASRLKAWLSEAETKHVTFKKPGPIHSLHLAHIFKTFKTCQLQFFDIHFWVLSELTAVSWYGQATGLLDADLRTLKTVLQTWTVQRVVVPTELDSVFFNGWYAYQVRSADGTCTTLYKQMERLIRQSNSDKLRHIIWIVKWYHILQSSGSRVQPLR